MHTFLLQKWYEHTCFVAKWFTHTFFVKKFICALFCHKKRIYAYFFCRENDLRIFFSRKRFTHFIQKVLCVESCHLESSDFLGLCCHQDNFCFDPKMQANVKLTRGGARWETKWCDSQWRIYSAAHRAPSTSSSSSSSARLNEHLIIIISIIISSTEHLILHCDPRFRGDDCCALWEFRQMGALFLFDRRLLHAWPTSALFYFCVLWVRLGLHNVQSESGHREVERNLAWNWVASLR